MAVEEEQTLDDIVEMIYDPQYQSVFTAVTGQNQSGKTNLNLLFMEILEESDLAYGFGSNVKDLEAPFHIDFIEDFKTLKKTCQMLNPNPSKYGLKRYFFFGSEMGKWVPKDQPWNKTTLKLLEEFQTVRKYGLSFLGDAIDRIDERILSPSFFHGKFVKKKHSLTTALYYDWLNGRKIWLYDIPKTKIKFDTYDSANFYMDPQGTEGKPIPLNYEHEIAFKYLDLGSWKKVGVSTQEGKRCIQKVIRFHRTHCVPSLDEDIALLDEIEAESTKDSVEVT